MINSRESNNYIVLLENLANSINIFLVNPSSTQFLDSNWTIYEIILQQRTNIFHLEHNKCIGGGG